MRLLFLLAAALIGCGPRTDWTLDIDPAFTAEECTRLRTAAQMWRDFAGADIELREPATLAGPPFILRVKPGAGADGTTTIPDGIVLLRPDFTTGQAAHEFGHLLGLGHVKSGVMQGTADPPSRFSGHDLEECERVGVCD
jgi:hypothetical protein